MKHMSLDKESEQVKRFIHSLSSGTESTVLELDGRPVLRVQPLDQPPVDLDKLKEAILRRRERSRELNAEWEHVDQEVWDAAGGRGEKE